MDRHKQLMDRYLPDEDTSATTDVKTKIMNMYVDMEQHNPDTGIIEQSQNHITMPYQDFLHKCVLSS
jgi:hypothetical protein